MSGSTSTARIFTGTIERMGFGRHTGGDAESYWSAMCLCFFVFYV